MAGHVTLNHIQHVYGTSGKLPALDVQPNVAIRRFCYNNTVNRSTACKIITTVDQGTTVLWAYCVRGFNGNEVRLGFTHALKFEDYNQMVCDMVELIRTHVVTNQLTGRKSVDCNGMMVMPKLGIGAHQYLREFISKKKYIQSAIDEIVNLYKAGPSKYSLNNDLIYEIIEIARAQVRAECREFNKTAVAPPKPIVMIDTIKAHNDLKQVIANTHMKTIQSACGKLKLSVNDYLYALQDVLQGQISVEDTDSLHIIS